MFLSSALVFNLVICWFCATRRTQIDAYLKSSTWPSRAPHVRVHTITVEVRGSTIHHFVRKEENAAFFIFARAC
jgi:hypothetical protein